MSGRGTPVVYIVACGGYVAGQLEDFIRSLQAQDWDVCVIATPAALEFMDTTRLQEVTGYVVRSSYKRPNEADVLPKPNAVVVVPATFNTINKWAGGISDTLALGVLNEAIGSRLPIVVVPTPNANLAKHPAFVENIATLQRWGVRFLFDPDALPAPGTGLAAANFFSWQALEAAVAEIRRQRLGDDK